MLKNNITAMRRGLRCNHGNCHVYNFRRFLLFVIEPNVCYMWLKRIVFHLENYKLICLALLLQDYKYTSFAAVFQHTIWWKYTVLIGITVSLCWVLHLMLGHDCQPLQNGKCHLFRTLRQSTLVPRQSNIFM